MLGFTAASIGRSLSQFRTSPLRTFLTLLGIVFGVGSVVGMVSVGEGAQREILSTIEAMGATTTHVIAKPVQDGELPDVVNDSAGLSRSDVDAFVAVLPDVERVAYRRRHALRVTDLPVSPHSISVMAASPEIFAVHNLRIKEGRRLVRSDHEGQRRTAVLGAKLARAVFPDGALGQRFRLDYAFFEVVGVLSDGAEIGDELPIDPEVYDTAVIIPYETAVSELSPPAAYGELELISIEVDSTEKTLSTKKALGPILKSLHGGVTDYDVVAPEEILQQKKAAQSLLNTVLISIAAISLLVGGIGIMNIMLANIMERISEIGLRRAVGARKADIRNQFLVESILICVVGGILGLVLGTTVGYGVASGMEIPFAFAWESMVLSFVISVGVGVIFGIVPAMRAANVDPIEALRGE